MASARACASRDGGQPALGAAGPAAATGAAARASGPRAFDTAGAMPASSPPIVASHRCDQRVPVDLPRVLALA